MGLKLDGVYYLKPLSTNSNCTNVGLKSYVVGAGLKNSLNSNCTNVGLKSYVVGAGLKNSLNSNCTNVGLKFVVSYWFSCCAVRILIAPMWD